jgi:hypothetical protein
MTRKTSALAALLLAAALLAVSAQEQVSADDINKQGRFAGWLPSHAQHVVKSETYSQALTSHTKLQEDLQLVFEVPLPMAAMLLTLHIILTPPLCHAAPLPAQSIPNTLAGHSRRILNQRRRQQHGSLTPQCSCSPARSMSAFTGQCTPPAPSQAQAPCRAQCQHCTSRSWTSTTHTGPCTRRHPCSGMPRWQHRQQLMQRSVRLNMGPLARTCTSQPAPATRQHLFKMQCVHGTFGPRRRGCKAAEQQQLGVAADRLCNCATARIRER